MKKIFIRSPYFIQVNEANQLGSKVELYLYSKSDGLPILPTYTLSKKIATSTQRENTYNISNYAKEFINPIKTYTTTVPVEEAEETWCYCLVKKYSEYTLNTYTLLSEETFVCLNGYTDYLGGYNNSETNTVLPLFNTDIKKYVKDYTSNYVNVFFEVGSYDIDNDITVYPFTVTEASMYRILLSNNVVKISKDGVGELYELNPEELCEAKYTPITCTFVNRFGGWEFLTFFKANKTSIDVEYKKFDLSPENVNYNPYLGVSKTFNQQGKQKITCNTGWVDENYFDLIQDLLLSQTVLLDNKPVIVKSQNSDKKTYIKEKNINYTIDFEYAYGLINDVI
jgi:hypothetical protein